MTIRLLTNIGRLWTGSEVWNNAAILTQGDRIAWVGPAAELPQSLPGVVDDIVDVDQVENLNGGLVTPGLIDAHTHPVYAGNRWAELAMRSGGSSANEIAAAGGGMASTATVTRGTDPWTLCNGVRARLAEIEKRVSLHTLRHSFATAKPSCCPWRTITWFSRCLRPPRMLPVSGRGRI